MVGRPAAHIADFDHSDSMREATAAGLIWTVADLQAFLKMSKDKVPGSRLSCPGLHDEPQHRDVIAVLYAHLAAE